MVSGMVSASAPCSDALVGSRAHSVPKVARSIPGIAFSLRDPSSPQGNAGAFWLYWQAVGGRPHPHPVLHSTLLPWEDARLHRGPDRTAMRGKN